MTNRSYRRWLWNGLAMLALATPSLAAAQDLTLVNAVSAGGNASLLDDVGNDVAVDASGNAVVTGSFNGTAIFGAGQATETTLTSVGSDDIFVARYAPDGTLINAVRAGGTSTDVGYGVAVDASGIAVVTGVFNGSATFGTGLGAVTLTSAGGQDGFVARYAPNGSLISAVQVGGTGTDHSYGVAVDASGNAVVTGRFVGTATFGAGQPNQTTLTSAGNSDIFVARYALNGTLLNAVRAGGANSDNVFDVAVDASGNAVVTGAFLGTTTFGAAQANETTLTGAGGNDVFVARFDLDGTFINVVMAGGTSDDVGTGVGVDASGNAVVTGYFNGTATFGAGQPNQTTLTSPGGSAMFVARYTPGGTFINAVSAGGVTGVFGYGVAVDASDNAVVTGSFISTATFDTDPDAVTLTSAGSQDVFVARYAPNGSLLGVVRAGGSSVDIGYDVAVSASGNAVVTGSFRNTATFGAGEVNQTTLTSAGGTDAFVARYALVNDAPLPVELSSFTGTSRNGAVSLSWSTATETDNAGFAVLRDGIEIASYRSLASLRGHGTTANRSAYAFTDARVQSGRSYTYTLRSADLSGATHDYAPRVTVTVEGAAIAPTAFRLLSAAPNPFNPTTTIRFDLPTAGAVQATLFNALGQPVRTVGGEFAAGAAQSLALDASGLPSGAYLVRLTAGTSTATVRVMLAK